jgi:hypothetical protein
MFSGRRDVSVLRLRLRLSDEERLGIATHVFHFGVNHFELLGDL